MFATTMSAGGKLTVSDVAGSKFSAKMVQGMNFILRDGCNMLKMAGRKKMIWY